MASENVGRFSLTGRVTPIISTKDLHFGKFILKYITKLEETKLDVLKNRWR